MKDRIKQLRKANHMTQTELGQKLGVVKQTVCAWEKGVNYPSVEILNKMSSLFSVPVDYISGNIDSLPDMPETKEEPQLTPYETRVLYLLRTSNDQKQLIKLMEKFNSLDDDCKDIILGKITELAMSSPKLKPTGTEGKLAKL